MWLITPEGFYSAVQKPHTSHLTIRARSAADLDRLRRRWIPELSTNEFEAGADYPVRAQCSHQAFAEGTARIASSIDYPEFRAQVAQTHSPDRAKVYNKVWSALLGIEREQTSRGPFPRAPKAAKLAYGALVLDAAHQRLLLRQTVDGHNWTFARAWPTRGESPEQTAVRAVATELGEAARVRGSLFRWYPGATSQSAYFLMEVEAEGGGFDPQQTARVEWLDIEMAQRRIEASHNPIWRQRDLQVLADLSRRLGMGAVAQAD